jgi:hypothetical protein
LLRDFKPAIIEIEQFRIVQETIERIIIEYIPGIDIEQTNNVNLFDCGICQRRHPFFIGVQLFNLHDSTKMLLSRYGL